VGRYDGCVKVTLAIGNEVVAKARNRAKTIPSGMTERSLAAKKPWMRFVGMVESGDARSSQSIDDIVYRPKG